MLKPVIGISSLIGSPPFKEETIGIFPARVKFIILDNKEQPQVFKDFGEWSSIGCLFFSSINNPNPSTVFTSDNFAKPLFPNNKNYPLKNEIVYILTLPNSNIQEDVNNISYYYFQPINIWNNSHHNAIPDPINNDTIPESQKRDYVQVQNGTIRRVTDSGTEIDLGKTFKEKLNIRNLQPFEGDIIYEGRWGQSLRFGSTVKNSYIPNSWSQYGEDGDPITIITNEQYDENKDSWIPQVEDINKKTTAIWLTSTQLIPLESDFKLNSYNTPPTDPNKFKDKPQIIIKSGRIIFYSFEDHILFLSKKSINLNSKESVNIDSPETTIQSNKVRLGDKKASESLILGDTFLFDLQKLLNSLVLLGNALQIPVGTPVPGAPHFGIASTAPQMTIIAQNMLNKIEKYKSKISKTK